MPENRSVLAGAADAERIYAAIGSERGWTDNERRLLEERRFIRTGMEARILRTETAATAAAAIIASSMDWM